MKKIILKRFRKILKRIVFIKFLKKKKIYQKNIKLKIRKWITLSLIEVKLQVGKK